MGQGDLGCHGVLGSGGCGQELGLVEDGAGWGGGVGSEEGVGVEDGCWGAEGEEVRLGRYGRAVRGGEVAETESASPGSGCSGESEWNGWVAMHRGHRRRWYCHGLLVQSNAGVVQGGQGGVVNRGEFDGLRVVLMGDLFGEGGGVDGGGGLCGWQGRGSGSDCDGKIVEFRFDILWLGGWEVVGCRRLGEGGCHGGRWGLGDGLGNGLRN